MLSVISRKKRSYEDSQEEVVDLQVDFDDDEDMKSQLVVQQGQQDPLQLLAAVLLSVV